MKLTRTLVLFSYVLAAWALPGPNLRNQMKTDNSTSIPTRPPTSITFGSVGYLIPLTFEEYLALRQLWIEFLLRYFTGRYQLPPGNWTPVGGAKTDGGNSTARGYKSQLVDSEPIWDGEEEFNVTEAPESVSAPL